MRIPRAAFAAALLGAVALLPEVAAARGAGSGGFFRGVVPAQPVALGALRARAGFRTHRFRLHHHNGQPGEPVVIGPPLVTAAGPPSYGDDPYAARPPVWRECISQTEMVPSSARGGFTAVRVTRCWRRN